jgi:hypothetical protein
LVCAGDALLMVVGGDANYGGNDVQQLLVKNTNNGGNSSK